MKIPIVPVPLGQLYRSVAKRTELEPIQKWRENVVLQDILHVLSLFCEEANVKGFQSFADFCNSLPDPSMAMAFSPIDHPRLHLDDAWLHDYIVTPRALMTEESNDPHCSLNVRFVGVAARELNTLFQTVRRPSSKSARSRTSVHSTTTLVQSMSDTHLQSHESNALFQTIRRPSSKSARSWTFVHSTTTSVQSESDARLEPYERQSPETVGLISSDVTGLLTSFSDADHIAIVTPDGGDRRVPATTVHVSTVIHDDLSQSNNDEAKLLSPDEEEIVFDYSNEDDDKSDAGSVTP
jgi:hypothetical protein